MSELVEISQQFHPVGQGMFFSGEVRLRQETYRFVYDCGSKSKRVHLEEEIDYHRHSRGRIDLLVISHFHEDHVNGITRLISGKHVKKLVIPYMDWSERLALILYSESEDADYIRLLTDPVSYFLSGNFEISELIVVGGPNGTTFNTEQFSPIFTPTDQSRNPNKEQDTESTRQLEETLTGERISPDDATLSIITNILPTSENLFRLSIVPGPLKISVGIYWEFIFYNEESADKSKMIAFEKDLKKLMRLKGWTKGDLFQDSNRKEVSDLYLKHYSVLNQTSIVLYHGSIKGQQAYSEGYFFSNDLNMYLPYSLPILQRTGTLLTGDIKMSTTKGTSTIRAYFSKFLENVSVFSLPHHGSRANWNTSHPNGLEKFDVYISTAGLGSKKHPSPLVVADVEKNCEGDHVPVNEVARYRYTILLEV